MAGRLDEEAVGPPHVLADLAVRLARGDWGDLARAQRQTQVPADLLRQGRVRGAAEDRDASVHDSARSGPPGRGWGGRIRTSECGLQRPVSYHLTTPQSAMQTR